MRSKFRAEIFALLALVSGAVAAHGGGLNAQGCHNDRKYGDYHCHRGTPASSASALRSSFAPAQSSRNRSSGDAAGAYANCTAARAAGAAPVRRGDAGYGGHLDRDNDGIGCE